MSTAATLFGTQGWRYGSWVGPFYPDGVGAADMLGHYGKAFPTVEVETTSFGIPASPVVEQWREQVPPGFTFALKLPQAITHERRFEDVADLMGRFLARAMLLEDRLGPILIQLSPAFRPTPEHRTQLAEFVRSLPDECRWAVEFRHQAWVDEETMALLTERGVALALVDGRWMPRRAVFELCRSPTARFAYVRWIGAGRRFTDFSRVQDTAERELAMWQEALGALRERVDTVYGYVGNNLQGHAPESVRALHRLLEAPAAPRTALRGQGEVS